MTPEEIALVAASAERVGPELRSVSADFYARLFAVHPEVREKFPAEIAGPEVKFAASIEAIVKAMPDFVAFADRTAALGRLHAAHRVSAVQYRAVGAVLLDVLAAHDPAWDAATRDAWATAYDLLAESMQMASRG